MKRKIYLSGDHAGFRLKEKIKAYLKKEGHEVKDFGPLVYKKGDDYPDYVLPMAHALIKETGAGKIPTKSARGIVIAGSGQGESISTNKLKGIRAGLYHGGSPKIVKTGREHDDLNVLCMGSRFVTEREAKKAIKIFLTEKFDEGRHTRRLKEFEKIGGK